MMESGYEYKIEEGTKKNIFWGFVAYFAVIGVMVITAIILTITHWHLHWNLVKGYWHNSPVLTTIFACSVILIIIGQIYLRKLLKKV